MRILGIDPGYATVGWGVVEVGALTRGRHDNSDDGTGVRLIDCGVITTDKSLGLPERLVEIAGDFEVLIDKFKPEIAGVETLLFQKNAKTAMSVSAARGVILYVLQKAALPIKEMSPLQVKDSISGYGKADKKQVQENVRIICGLEEIPKPDDAADAVAIAICAHDLYQNSQL